MQSFLIRRIHLDHGNNHIALSAEHRIIGADHSTSSDPTKAYPIDLTIAENTAMTNIEEGLVYRNAYVAYVGERIPHNLGNALETAYVADTVRNSARVVVLFPAEKR